MNNQKNYRYLSLLAIIVGLGGFYFQSFAQDSAELFNIDVKSNDYLDNTNEYVATRSKKAFGGSYWLTFAFAKDNDGLKTGFKDINATATFTSESAIPYKIGKIKANFGLSPFTNNGLKSIYLKVCDQNNFSNDCENCKIIYDVNNTDLNKQFSDLEFIIPKPQENEYYQLCVSTNQSNNAGWCYLKVLRFYASNDTDTEIIDQPVMAQEDEYNVRFSFVSHSGDLHLMAWEYDNKNNPIREVNVDQTIQLMSLTHNDFNTTDANWSNWVAGRDNKVYLTTPETGNFYKIRSKSVVNDGDDVRQSEELVSYISRDGILTVLEAINDENNPGTEKWYNLQGHEVKVPSNGIFIHVVNNKATKVKI